MLKPPVMPKYSPAQAAMAHNTTVKESMAEAVINTLYGDTDIELNNTLIGIATDNNLLLKSSHLSFMYRGRYYNLEPEQARYPDELESQLHERMNDYLAEAKQVREYEIPVIRGILKSLFMASDRISDYKQVLPEFVHGAFNGYHDGDAVRRTLLPQDIAKFQKRVEPFITIMKGRMLQNFIQGKTP